MQQNQKFLFSVLNDGIDHSAKNARLVENDLKVNFYEKLFPTVSKFEIGFEAEYRDPKSVLSVYTKDYEVVDIGYNNPMSISSSFKASYFFATFVFFLFLLKCFIKKPRDYAKIDKSIGFWLTPT